jgi:hypothetical protein
MGGAPERKLKAEEEIRALAEYLLVRARADA